MKDSYLQVLTLLQQDYRYLGVEIMTLNYCKHHLAMNYMVSSTVCVPSFITVPIIVVDDPLCLTPLLGM